MGNTLAYLHDDEDVAAAFETFAAHLGAGGVLVVQTMTSAVEGPPATSRVDGGELHAEVTVSCSWDPVARVSTMRRDWCHDGGGEDRDVVVRRVWEWDELRRQAARVGLQARRPSDSRGGWFVATYD